MMRSMMSAVAGLRAQQTAMDVIGNNISNVNTAGFKASNINFTDLFYQTLQQGNEAVNPTQVGYGSRVGSVDKDMSSTGATNTDNPLDLYIDGEGFFAMNTKADGTGTTYYSRLGNFHIDPSGYLVDSNGAYVMGAKGSGTNTTVGSPICLMGATFHSTTGQTIKIEGDTYKQLSNIQVNGDGTVSASLADQVGVLSSDSINSSPVKDTVFLPTTAGAAVASSGYAALTSVVVGNDGNVTATIGATTGTIVKLTNLIGGTFMPTDITKGGPVQITSTNAADFKFTANADGTVNVTYTNGAFSETGTMLGSDGKPFNIVGEMYQDGTNNPHSITSSDCATYYYTINTDGSVEAYTDSAMTTHLGTGKMLGKQMNMFGETFQSSDGVSGQTMNASDYNNFTGITFHADGTVTSSYNGIGGTMTEVAPQDLQIALATFVNPNGLYESGNSYYTANISSGDPSYIGASDGNSTVIRSGELEMSNVDLAKEFTNMIVTQRGFQANSRVITVSDSMLEELVNLKRS